MTTGKPKNIAVSVHAKLVNKSKELGVDVNILRIRFGLERFLYRLGQSEHSEKFTLKGALLFLMWSNDIYRPTKDADFLLSGKSDEETIHQMIIDACNVDPGVDDGMSYDAETIILTPIKEGQKYQGIRVVVEGVLGHIPIPVQLDIGTGDAVTPGPMAVTFTRLLSDFPAPEIMVYPRETVAAEKLEAMVSLDMANSRLKDYYDLWMILVKLSFNADILREAIVATFKRRETQFPEKEIPSLTPRFYDDPVKQTQWQAFLRKNKIASADLSLEQACKEIAAVLDSLL